ncbi:hypothetical protein AX17_004432 [Amanita inopinata Kibby_2008]|nr:hypothetical protein AX17_004432 [Amanita inopinata Kibby_2008]
MSPTGYNDPSAEQSSDSPSPPPVNNYSETADIPTDEESDLDEDGYTPEPDTLAEQEAEERREVALCAEEQCQAEELQPLGGSDDNQGGENNADSEDPASTIENVRILQEFIKQIRSARLEESGLDTETIERLRNPPEDLVDISDPDIRLSLDIFLAGTNASEQVYKSSREAILYRFPDCKMLSFYEVKKLVAELSGIVSVEDDMCVNSCHAFVGPLAGYEACIICHEPRYDPVQQALTGAKVPQLQATTFPLGPQLQARRHCPASANAAKYCEKKYESILQSADELHDPDNGEDFIYDDCLTGSDFITLKNKYVITSDDTLLAFSVDGAQLYQNKKSDTWIAIWILLDLAPNQ